MMIVFTAAEIDDFLVNLMQKVSELVDWSCWIDMTLTEAIKRELSRDADKECFRRGTGGGGGGA